MFFGAVLCSAHESWKPLMAQIDGVSDLHISGVVQRA
jgi:hypothetical protein